MTKVGVLGAHGRVGTAVVASIAMLIWFFAFAGNPLPT